MPEDTGDLISVDEMKSDGSLKYKDHKKGLVWSDNASEKDSEKGSRLKRFAKKIFPFVRSFKHDQKRRSFLIGAAAGTVGTLGYLKGAEKAEAFLNSMKPEDTQDNPPPSQESNSTPQGKEQVPSKNSANQFEQFVLASAPIEKQRQVSKLMMEKLEFYQKQVGVEEQLNNTLSFASLLEKVLREYKYPEDQIERRKYSLLAQIFVESGGNQFAEQGDPECKNPKMRDNLWMGQGLFQVNLTAAKDVIERFKFNLTNIKDPEQNTKLAVLYTKMMEDIFSDELIATNAYHTGQGNMRVGIEAFLKHKLGVTDQELKDINWLNLKNYLQAPYPQLGDRTLSLFDLFMDPQTVEAMKANAKKNNSTISFDYSFKLLAAARLLFEKENSLLAKDKLQ